MIASINGISNTTMQDNTIQKEKAIENVVKEDKQDKSVSEEKFDYSKNLFKPWSETIKEFIDKISPFINNRENLRIFMAYYFDINKYRSDKE